MSTTAVFNSQGNVAQYARKNIFINGDFKVWQRGTADFTTNEYTADRWVSSSAGSALNTISFERFPDDDPYMPDATQNYLKMAIAANAATNSFAQIYQRVEFPWAYANKQVTLSFRARSPTSLSTTFEVGRNAGGSGTFGLFSKKFQLTPDWQDYSVTFTMPAFTEPTFNPDDYWYMIFWGTAGSDFDSRSDSLGNQSGEIDFSNVQLEFGDTATRFEYRSYETELALCQRYYYVVGINTVASAGWYQQATSLRCAVPLPVAMRKTPTLTTTPGACRVYDSLDSSGFVGAPTAISIAASTTLASVALNVTTGTRALYRVGVLYTTGTTELKLDAEL